MSYSHTQNGYLMISISGVVLAAMAFAFLGNQREGWLIGAVMIILVATTWLFSSLTVKIDNGQLKFSFGPGWIRKTIELSTIADCRPGKSAWYNGWGIHLTNKGWLYNVSGWEVVEITLKNGHKIFLGTDEPETLTQAIKSSLKL